MKPVLLSFGSFNVYAFGLFLALAFIISTLILYKYAREELKEVEYFDAYLYTCIAGLFVSRLVYIILHWNDFGFNILRFFLVRETPGLSFIGGITGGLLFLWWYCSRKKFNTFHIFDLLSVVFSLGFIFIKIGEQLGGAAYGRETKFITGVRIIGKIGQYHPVELYEAFVFIVMTAILAFLYRLSQRNKWPEGFVFIIFTLMTSLSVFVLEFFKVFNVYLYKFSLRQLFCLGIIAIVIIPLIKNIKIINSNRRIIKT
jgi:phosphatidylglycerol---prolipoprotein diacylglyceryl transferase